MATHDTSAQSSSPSTPDIPVPLTLPLGCKVMTHSLRTNLEQNDRMGVIEAYLTSRGRYAVRIQGVEKLANLKPENVRVVTEMELKSPPNPSSLALPTTTTQPPYHLLLIILWIVLVLTSLSPMSTLTMASSISYVKQACMWDANLDPMEKAMFNLLGLFPLVSMSFFWHEASMAQKVAICASFLFGNFILLPVLVFIVRNPPSLEPVGGVLRSEIFTGILVMVGAGLCCYGMMFGNAARLRDAIDAEPFLHFMAIDFVCFMLSSAIWIARESTSIALGLLAIFPVIGPAGYLHNLAHRQAIAASSRKGD